MFGPLFFLLEIGVDCFDVSIREGSAAVDEDVFFSAVFVLDQKNRHAQGLLSLVPCQLL